MANREDVRARTTRFLVAPENDRPVSESADDETLGEAADEPLTFSVFLRAHEVEAIALAARFMSIANEESPDEALDAVLDAAEEAAKHRSSELVKHALMVFITHHPRGRELPIPPLEQRAPERVIPSHTGDELEDALLGALGVEAQLDYFREDIAVNDHHERWHIVYPTEGHPDPANPSQGVAKDRQGELFWYMHQQMLARYDTERKAFDLSPVAAFNNYRSAIAEGYDANLPEFSNRPAEARLRDLSWYSIAQHEAVRDGVREAIREGALRAADGSRRPITANLLGSTIEANVDSADREGYGEAHNFGHVLIAAVPKQRPPGVMHSPVTAVRDPIFFRWHRHVDDLFVQWQETLEPYDFSVGAPPVKLRRALDGSRPVDASPDILLCSETSLPALAGDGFDGQAYGEQQFGGTAWGTPLASFPTLTDELETTLRSQTVALRGGRREVKPFLDHEEYCYFIRMENGSNAPRKVTVRMFLAAEALASDRRMWIEMDKFTQELAANQRAVVYRPARLSAVVRKPARRPLDPRRAGRATRDADYCDCGWPYHLLLPRGTPQGMPCKLLVMLTDFEADLVGAEKKCGSMSFCGAKDARYPDKRPMGYPFDRPFADSLQQAMANADHMATRSLRIRHTGSNVIT